MKFCLDVILTHFYCLKVLQISFIVDADLEISQGYQGRNEEEESRNNQDELLVWSQWAASLWVTAVEDTCLPELPSPATTQIGSSKRGASVVPTSTSKALTTTLSPTSRPSLATGACSRIHKLSLSCTWVERETS